MSIFTRNSISLETPKPGDNEYYDQACALSQKTINASFKKIFEMRPELGDISWTDERIELKATVGAPQVEFDMLSFGEPQLYFRIDFLSGQVVFDGADVQSLDRWVITVTSALKELTVSKVPNRDAKEETKAKKALADLSKTFVFPTEVIAGEYSIHRLFAAIAEHKWSSPVSSKSFAPLSNGKLVNLDEWASDKESARRSWDVLNAIGLWARMHQYSSIFTLGMQMRLPVPEENPLQPNFAPKALRLQNYPYISEQDQQKLIDQGKPFQGTSGDDLNCLVFCETTGTRGLPEGEQIPFRGNLATPDMPGTFVLERRLFIEKYLLPQLQELCVATQIIPIWPDMGYDTSGMDHWQAQLVVGGNPPNKEDHPGLPPQVSTDPSFRFRPQGKTKYVWSNHLRAPGSGPADIPGAMTKTFDESVRKPFFRKWTINTNQSVTVTWEPGSDTFKIVGKSTYDHWEAYSSHSNFTWGTGHYGPGGGLYGSIIIETSWSIEVDLYVPEVIQQDTNRPNGIIYPKIKGCDASWLPLDITVVPQMHYVLDETHIRIKNQIFASLQRKLPEVNKRLQESFNTTGRFVYPGSGELSFGPPTITENGNIIARIDYLEPKGDRIIVKPPSKAPVSPTPEPIKSPVVIAPPIRAGNPPRLTWRTNVREFNPKTKRCKITLTAWNLLESLPVAFWMIKVLNLSNDKTTPSPGPLFTQDRPNNWKMKKTLPPPESEESTGAAPTAGANETESTASPTLNVGEKVDPAAPATSSAASKEKPKPESVDVYGLSQDNIAQPLQIKPDYNKLGLFFTVKPAPGDDEEVPDRFVQPSGSSFEIELEGSVKGKGVWVLQMNEVWNAVADGETLTGQTANTFLRVELKEGFGTVDAVAEEVANGIRGIKPT